MVVMHTRVITILIIFVIQILVTRHIPIIFLVYSEYAYDYDRDEDDDCNNYCDYYCEYGCYYGTYYSSYSYEHESAYEA